SVIALLHLLPRVARPVLRMDIYIRTIELRDFKLHGVDNCLADRLPVAQTPLPVLSVFLRRSQHGFESFVQ
ncbi:MAG TPA: hypothetical protein V6D12_07420, partial [Candidatus Obscuribacterales bacterium]